MWGDSRPWEKRPTIRLQSVMIKRHEPWTVKGKYAVFEENKLIITSEILQEENSVWICSIFSPGVDNRSTGHLLHHSSPSYYGHTIQVCRWSYKISIIIDQIYCCISNGLDSLRPLQAFLANLHGHYKIFNLAAEHQFNIDHDLDNVIELNIISSRYYFCHT